MYSDNIKEENGHYVIEDSTSGGYVDRMTPSLSQTWESVWDKNLNFISLKSRWGDLTEALNQKDKEHEDYYKGIRAKNRHLKMLKEHLGISIEEKKVPKKRESIIYLRKGPLNKLDKLNVQPAIMHERTVKITGEFGLIKKHDLHFTHSTPEKEALMQEYNHKLAEFKEFKEYIFNVLFGGK